MKFIYSLFILVLFYSCQKEPQKILASDYLNEEQVESFKYEIIRYTDKLAKKATHETKFDSQFDSIYQVKAKNAELYHYFVDKKSNEIYFAIARIAPSLKVKKVVTIGKLEKDAKGAVVYVAGKPMVRKGTAKDLDSMRANTLKLYQQYDEVRKMFIDEESNLRIWGGGTESLLDSAGLIELEDE